MKGSRRVSRTPLHHEDSVRYQDLQVEVDMDVVRARLLSTAGEHVADLGLSDAAALLALIAAKGQVVRRSTLIDLLFAYGDEGEKSALRLENHIKLLRKHLKAVGSPLLIVAVGGVRTKVPCDGWKLEAP